MSAIPSELTKAFETQADTENARLFAQFLSQPGVRFMDVIPVGIPETYRLWATRQKNAESNGRELPNAASLLTALNELGPHDVLLQYALASEGRRTGCLVWTKQSSAEILGVILSLR